MSVISRFIYIEQSTTTLQLQSRNIGPFLFPENHSTETYRFFLIWSLNWTVLHIQDLRRHSRERCCYVLEEKESSGRRLVVFNVIFASYNVANSMDHIQALWLAVPLANDRELALVGGRGEEIGEAILFMKRKFSIIFHQTIIKIYCFQSQNMNSFHSKSCSKTKCSSCLAALLKEAFFWAKY